MNAIHIIFSTIPSFVTNVSDFATNDANVDIFWDGIYKCQTHISPKNSIFAVQIKVTYENRI